MKSNLIVLIIAGILSSVICVYAISTYSVECIDCEYADNEISIGTGEEGGLIAIALCPNCKRIYEVKLKNGDIYGKKKYKCVGCKEKLYFYRDADGALLFQINVEEKYQCPDCSLFTLQFTPIVEEEEVSLIGDEHDDTEDATESIKNVKVED